MSGYQRMVSYLYRYDCGVKGKNVGYVRMERRGERCRVTVQLQDALNEMPEFSFFVQEKQTLHKIPIGRLSRNAGGFRARAEMDCDHIMQSQYTYEQLDGLIIVVSENVLYATTWKDLELDFSQNSQRGAEKTGVPENAQTNGVGIEKIGVPENVQMNGAGVGEIGVPENVQVEMESHGNGDVIPEMQEYAQNHSGKAQMAEREKTASAGKTQAMREEDILHGFQAAQLQQGNGEKQEQNQAAHTQAAHTQVAHVGSVRAIGEKLLADFPRMYPFEIAQMGACVRLDLKDIGCLPVKYWSLAGNPLLLQGYFCYRHLIFASLPDGVYAVGIPGIYNEQNSQKARECGMQSFQPLSQVESRQGAFGYWLYEMRDAERME